MELTIDELQLHRLSLKKLSAIIYEYLLVISLDKAGAAQVAEIKNFFKSSYRCGCAAGLIPHITMVNFIQYERNEKKVNFYLERFSKSINPFEIQLNGFGHFESHTIYVNVGTKAPI